MNAGDKVWWLKEVRRHGLIQTQRLPAVFGCINKGRAVISVIYPDGQRGRKSVYPETIIPRGLA